MTGDDAGAWALSAWRRTTRRGRLTALAVICSVAVASRLARTNPRLSVALVGALVLVGIVTAARRLRDGQPGWCRRGWALLGVACGVFGLSSALRVGDLIYTSAGPVEVISLVANAFAVAGFAALLRHRAPRRSAAGLGEAAFVALSAAYVTAVLSRVSGARPGELWVAVVAANAASAWLSLRLFFVGTDRPIVLRLLATGTVAKLSANLAASVVGAGPSSGRGLASLQLWVLALWAFAAVHPSLGRRFEPVRDREVTDVSARAAVFAAGVVMVLAVVGLQVLFGARGDTVFVGASVLPVAVVLHMTYQMLDRGRVEHRLLHDGLTGLANRRLFGERVADAIAADDAVPFAVVVLDLDRFKRLNDSLGHADANLVLTAVAARLASEMRAPDLAARIGGDEFGLLLHGVDASIADAAADAVRQCFATAFEAGHQSVYASASLGLALWPADADSAEELIERASTALHEAKARGRNRHATYRRDMSTRAALRVGMESSIKRAVANGEMSLHYQPQVSVETGRLVGLEALARWHHPALGNISPAAFIPLAETCGVIESLGAWAIQEACAQISAWRAASLPVVPVAVNVSAQQLTASRLGDVIEHALRAHGVPGDLLEIELTESVLVDDFTEVSEFLDRMQTLGVRTAIDDFGTGYSGLRYLSQLPIDTLKIDRSFVAGLGVEGADTGIVRAVLGLADSLGLDVVAEGVETTEQARFLREHGCERLQGFLISSAVPADSVPPLLLTDALLQWTDLRSDPIMAPVPATPSAQADRAIDRVLEVICRDDAGPVDVLALETVAAAFTRPSPPDLRDGERRAPAA